MNGYFGYISGIDGYSTSTTSTVAIFKKLLGYIYVSSWPSVVAERDLQLAGAVA